MPKGKRREPVKLTLAESTLLCYEHLIERSMDGTDDGRGTLASAGRLMRAEVLRQMNGRE